MLGRISCLSNWKTQILAASDRARLVSALFNLKQAADPDVAADSTAAGADIAVADVDNEAFLTGCLLLPDRRSKSERANRSLPYSHHDDQVIMIIIIR